ncbi:MAG: hypothetical protein NVSMB18_07420 [Acetobacteraceae bacterium]
MTELSGLEGLAVLVRESAASGVGRHAVLLRMDILPPGLSRPQHLRLARAALDPLTFADRARKHELPGGRFAVSWRGDCAPLLQKSLNSLEILLQDSPLDAPSVSELVARYALPEDGPALLRDAAGAGAAAHLEVPDANTSAPPDEPLAPLDVAGLSVLERRLAGVDMARFVRRRPVCRHAAGRMQLAWEERLFSVSELIETVAPGWNAEADPWLFRRLTRLFDRRMLALLGHPEELRGAGPFSIGLNVASILSPEFLRFDAALLPALRGSIVLDLSPADVLSDPAAFAFARNFARTRSYRLSLKSATAALLPMLNLPSLEMDFLQLRWSPELAAMDRSALPTGSGRWVLGGFDDPAAITWGESVGIGLFQHAVTATKALVA